MTNKTANIAIKDRPALLNKEVYILYIQKIINEPINVVKKLIKKSLKLLLIFNIFPPYLYNLRYEDGFTPTFFLNNLVKFFISL